MRLAAGNRIFLREEGHSNSNLIAIVLDNRPPQRNEFLAFWGGVLGGYVPTESAY